MTEKDLKYLSDILQAIELIESFTKSITEFDEYDKDLKTQSAVEYNTPLILYQRPYLLS